MKLMFLLTAMLAAVAADEMWGRYGYGFNMGYPMRGRGWGMSWRYPRGGYWNSWRYPMYGGGGWGMRYPMRHYPMYGNDWDNDWN